MHAYQLSHLRGGLCAGLGGGLHCADLSGHKMCIRDSINGVKASYLASAFHAMEMKYGSVENYLCEACLLYTSRCV